MAPCPPARLLAKHSLCFGLYVEAQCKFAAWYIVKGGEKLSQMLAVQLRHMLTLQKSPDELLLGDDIFFQQLAKKENNK